MPGPRDDPPAPDHQAQRDARADVDRMRLSPGDERRLRALAALPPGHPSSPYLADGSRRPPAQTLRSLELPFPGEKAERRPGTADNLTAQSDRAPQSDTPARPEGRHRSYWTEVPHFERKWAEHEREWPKHEQPAATVDRSHDPPGSWRSDSNLLLSPEDNARTKEAISRVQAAETRVTTDLGQVAQRSAFGAELVGLEFRRKGEDRLKEKVAETLQRRPDMPPEAAVLDISDAIRYTIRLGYEDYTNGYKDISDHLTESGYSLFYTQNHWEDPEYKGINTRWTTPDGNRFEVQFHTMESYHAKQEVTHEAYERIRNPLTSDDERSALKSFQRDVSSWIPVPEGATGIPDLRREPF